MAAGPLIALAALVGLGALALSSKAKAAPPAPGAAPHSGTFEFDPNLPPQLEAQALAAIKLGTAPDLRTFPAQLPPLGFHFTAPAPPHHPHPPTPVPHP